MEFYIYQTSALENIMWLTASSIALYYALKWETKRKLGRSIEVNEELPQAEPIPDVFGAIYYTETQEDGVVTRETEPLHTGWIEQHPDAVSSYCEYLEEEGCYEVIANYQLEDGTNMVWTNEEEMY